MKRLSFVQTFLVFSFLIFTCGAGAQTAHPAPDVQFRGFNAYESLRGTTTSSGTVFKLDSSVGYDFNRNLGVFFGAPLYFTHDPASSTLPAQQRSGIGDLYFGGDVYLPNRVADFTSTLTIGMPTGNVAEGFGTGHTTADWSNRLRRKMGRLSPFTVAGVSNSVPDTETLTRSFSSLGNLLHFEEGAEFDLTRRVYVGASIYQIVPFGNQEVFSRTDDSFRTQDQGSGKTGGNGNPTNPAQPAPAANPDQPTVAGNNITRENGVDTWIGFEPVRTLRAELGYSRSTTFAVNRLSFSLSLNVGRMLRLRRSQ